MKKFLFIPVLLFAAGCVGDRKDSTDYVKSVCVSEVGGERQDSLRHFAGIVKEQSNVSLGFKTAGQISKIYVKEGDRVSAGQLLATLDDSDYKLGVDALQIQYNQLKDEVDRARRLFEKKSLNANDYEKAEAGLKQLGIQLQVNKNKLDYTRLYAPTGGVIESVKFSPAEMVDAGTAVFTLLNTAEMEVICDVPVQVYEERSRFAGFSCRASSGSGESYGLRLLNIVPKADGNQLYRMFLGFEGRGSHGGLTAGKNVEVTVRLAGEGESLSVPAKAVFHRDGANWVWVVSGGEEPTVSARRVEIGKKVSGGFIDVIEGLQAGETVVRAGVSALHEGERVKIFDLQSSETNAGGEL